MVWSGTAREGVHFKRGAFWHNGEGILIWRGDGGISSGMCLGMVGVGRYFERGTFQYSGVREVC